MKSFSDFFSIGLEVRGDIPIDIPHMRSVYLQGTITKDLGDKFELDVTNNSNCTLYRLEEGFSKGNPNILGEFKKYSIEEKKVIRLPQTLMVCPKEFLRPCRVIVYETEDYAPRFTPTLKKEFLKEGGYYSCGKILGFRFITTGTFGILQDTFDKLMSGEKEEKLSYYGRSFRLEKLCHRTSMYFTDETIEFYNLNKK